MPWLTNILGGIWGYVGAAVIAAALAASGTYYVTSRSFEVAIANMKADRAEAKAADVTASINKLESIIASMHQAGVDYGTTQAALFAKLDSLRGIFGDAIKAKPLPADCRPDDVRVRSLAGAIGAANAAAAGPSAGTTMRTTH